MYLCSLSKIFAPGVRLGYLTASSPELFERIMERRHDAGPNTLAAAITAEYLDGRLWEHCEMANRGLKAKRDAMLAALESELGNTCSWSRPPGGLFIWVRLPVSGCVKPRIFGEQRSLLPATHVSGDDSERRVGF